MLKFFRIFLGIIVLALVIIQLIPSELPTVTDDNPQDLLLTAGIPGEVSELLKNSCYDCHSNETYYPWYSYVAPARWLVVRDVKDGREELNFSLWQEMSKKDKIKFLDEMAEEVGDEKMPLPVYTIIHGDARLDDSRKKQLMAWTLKYSEELLGE